jgi:hypothetical protein
MYPPHDDTLLLPLFKNNPADHIGHKHAGDNYNPGFAAELADVSPVAAEYIADKAKHRAFGNFTEALE